MRSELERTWRQIEAFGAVVEAGDYVDAIIDTADPDARPIPRPDVRRMLVPIGPVAVFGASNFPLAFSTAGGDTASALAAGCPVVVKGHPSHPGTSAVVAREVRAAVESIGLPEGTFALLQSSGVEVGEALVDEPAIAAVGFTGSLAGGRALLRPRRRAARSRSRSTPRWAASTRSSSRAAALRARAGAIAEGLDGVGGERSAASSARSRASCSCRRARRATRSSPTSPRASPPPTRRSCSTSACATRSPTRVAELAELVGGRSGAGAPRTARASASRPAAFRAAAADLAREPGAARGALRAGRAAARLPLRGGAARRARPRRGPAHRLAARRARGRAARAARSSTCSPRAPGRLVFDGFPTGVAVTHGMTHGGPYPATTAPGHDVGRHDRDRALPAPGRVAERARARRCRRRCATRTRSGSGGGWTACRRASRSAADGLERAEDVALGVLEVGELARRPGRPCGRGPARRRRRAPRARSPRSSRPAIVQTKAFTGALGSGPGPWRLRIAPLIPILVVGAGDQQPVVHRPADRLRRPAEDLV